MPDRHVTGSSRLGHAVKWDPPSLETKVERWSCACGAAVLRYGGNAYGSALTQRCTACPTCNGSGRVEGQQ